MTVFKLYRRFSKQAPELIGEYPSGGQASYNLKGAVMQFMKDFDDTYKKFTTNEKEAFRLFLKKHHPVSLTLYEKEVPWQDYNRMEEEVNLQVQKLENGWYDILGNLVLSEKTLLNWRILQEVIIDSDRFYIEEAKVSE